MQNGEEVRKQTFNHKNFVYDSEKKRYYFEFSNIMTTELDNMLVFTSTVGGVENDSLIYFINYYLSENMNGKAGDLVEALFNYGYSCDNF